MCLNNINVHSFNTWLTLGLCVIGATGHLVERKVREESRGQGFEEKRKNGSSAAVDHCGILLFFLRVFVPSLCTVQRSMQSGSTQPEACSGERRQNLGGDQKHDTTRSSTKIQLTSDGFHCYATYTGCRNEWKQFLTPEIPCARHPYKLQYHFF